jgi:hypothetical protein
MGTSIDIQLGLDDLLADLQYARRNHELGRLALLAYCEVRSWARQAGMPYIAQGAAKMFTESPCISKDEFLEKIDGLIDTLECHQQAYRKSTKNYGEPSEAATNRATSLLG